MRRYLLAIAVVLSSWSALAEESAPFHITTPESNAMPEASADCTSGVVYDDGGFVDFYGFSPAFVVMRFDLPGGTTALDQVCASFARLNADAPANLPFDVVVFDDNGAGGTPGAFLGAVAATATNIPIAGNSDFYNVSLAGSGILLPDTSVYVGVHFDSPNHLVSGDRSEATTQRPIYLSGNGTSWTNAETAFSGNGPRAWGIRVDPAIVTPTCVPTAEVVCLNGGRFKVAATFETPNFVSQGNARAVKLTNDTGYFWFFNSTNVEAVVKVLDGCGYNGRYWFFAGGLTNLHTVITVTDTSNGAVRTYSNPQGTAFQPIQDTSAFATCP